ncbi:MAG: GNAT family N-acetyltransferase, partial [bacterium]|nr:GNAT family N-acetyltransferase [bacterium]
MWTFLNIHELPRGETPTTWLDRVLPRPRGTYLQHCTRARQAIRNNALDESLTVFASDDRGPVGLVLIAGGGDQRNLELLGVRGDRRHMGLGKILLERVISTAKDRGVRSVSAPRVSSANPPFVNLLNTLGFEGQGTQGIRMRRSLDIPVPAYEVPPEFDLRTLQPGEEQAFVDLKNECFPERHWTLENFEREYQSVPIFDYNR